MILNFYSVVYRVDFDVIIVWKVLEKYRIWEKYRFQDRVVYVYLKCM